MIYIGVCGMCVISGVVWEVNRVCRLDGRVVGVVYVFYFVYEYFLWLGLGYV